MKKLLLLGISLSFSIGAFAQVTLTDKESGSTQTFGLFGSTNKQGEQISEEVLNSFKKGVTTYDELIAKLGKPNSEQDIKGLKTVTYTSSKGEVKVDPVRLIPIIGSFFGSVKNDQSRQNITFIFDANNLLMMVQDASTKGAVEDKGLVDKINKMDIKVGN